MEWSRVDLIGRVELIGNDDSTLARVTVEGDDPESELSQVLERLSRALDEVENVEGASFTLEPDAGSGPNEKTSSDQPLGRRLHRKPKHSIHRKHEEVETAATKAARTA